MVSLKLGAKGQGCVALLGGFLILASLGQMHTITNMTPYVISYMHERLDSDVNYSFGIWISTGSISFYASSMPISGLLAQKFDISKLIIISGFLNRVLERIKEGVSNIGLK
nr:oxalate:formate antiporter [Hymenolepis microstoma]